MRAQKDRARVNARDREIEEKRKQTQKRMISRLKRASKLRKDANANELLLRRKAKKKKDRNRLKAYKARHKKIEIEQTREARNTTLKRATKLEVFRLLQQREREQVKASKQAAERARLRRIRAAAEKRERKQKALEEKILRGREQSNP